MPKGKMQNAKSQFKIKKFLVTGGAGFIGSHIVKELVKRSHQVKVIDNLSTGNKANLKDVAGKIDFVRGDIRNLKLLQKEFVGFDYVCHQAALCSVPRSIANPLATKESNIDGTLNVLLAARDNKVKRVIFASSSSVYGDIKTEFKKEEDRGEILSPYALTKLAGEVYCQLFYKIYGLETVCLRYFNVFGPGQDPESQYAAVIPKFILAMIGGERPVIYGDGQQSRDFTYVANNVEANIIAATSKVGAGEVFNIACAQNWSLNKLVDILNEILKTKIKPKYAGRRIGDVKYSQASIDKARRTFGFKPKISFREGLEETVQWHLRRMRK